MNRAATCLQRQGLAGAAIAAVQTHRKAQQTCMRFFSVVAKALIPASVAMLSHGIAVADSAAPLPDAARRTELVRLVRQDCGSCHGLTLRGGLGPALLPETLADKPAIALKATILRGRPGTAMPPWNRFLNDVEAEWIVTNLQKGFPREP